MKYLNYQEIKDRLFSINRSLRSPNGLYFASAGEHYREYCWWRDIFYQVLPNLVSNPDLYRQTYQTFIDYLHWYRYKMVQLIDNPSTYNAKTCLHPRIYPDLTEVERDWGNMQMDAICLMLFGICLGEENGIRIIRSDADRAVIQKCIDMYERLEYWHLAGCDAWEENVEVHSHAIGAALAALTKLKDLGFMVNEEMLYLCRCELDNLLPAESVTKRCDLAQLQLIFPLNIVNESQKAEILHNVETKLLRTNGVIRYEGDVYYNVASEDSFRMFNSLYYPQWKGWHNLNELQWTFGLSYLSIIYANMGDMDKAKYYLDRVISDAGEDLTIPEGYYALTCIKNPNNPLGWSNALAITAIDRLQTEHQLVTQNS